MSILKLIQIGLDMARVIVRCAKSSYIWL